MGDSDIGQSLIGIHRYGPARSSFARRKAHETFAKPNAKNANAILTLLLCSPQCSTLYWSNDQDYQRSTVEVWKPILVNWIVKLLYVTIWLSDYRNVALSRKWILLTTYYMIINKHEYYIIKNFEACVLKSKSKLKYRVDSRQQLYTHEFY